MKTLVTAIALLCGAAGASQAATYKAVFSDLTDYNSGIWRLGGDPRATTMTFTWEVDEAPRPLAGPYSYTRTSNYSFDYVFLPYKTFSVTVGGVTFYGGASTTTSNRIYLRDGIADGRYGINDYMQVFTTTNRSLSDGWYVDYFYMSSYDDDETSVSGLDHPGVQELSGMAGHGGQIVLRNATSGSYAYVTSSTLSEVSEISVMPLPAAAPLMIAGLAALGLLRRRKRRAALSTQ